MLTSMALPRRPIPAAGGLPTNPSHSSSRMSIHRRRTLVWAEHQATAVGLSPAEALVHVNPLRRYSCSCQAVASPLMHLSSDFRCCPVDHPHCLHSVHLPREPAARQLPFVLVLVSPSRGDYLCLLSVVSFHGSFLLDSPQIPRTAPAWPTGSPSSESLQVKSYVPLASSVVVVLHSTEILRFLVQLLVETPGSRCATQPGSMGYCHQFPPIYCVLVPRPAHFGPWKLVLLDMMRSHPHWYDSFAGCCSVVIDRSYSAGAAGPGFAS